MRRFALTALLAVAAAAGCDKVKQAASDVADKAQSVGQDLGDKAKEVTKSAVETAKGAGQDLQEKVDTNGKFEFTAENKVAADACHVMFVKSVGGRDALLQLRSYTPDEGGYPAVMLHAPVQAGSLQELAGETVETRMFVEDETGTIWDNVDGPPVSLRIDSVDDKELKATFAGGQLRNSSTGESHEVTGSLIGAVSQ